MGSSTDVLNVARHFLDIGTREVPDGSNRVAGITDQGGFIPAAWCDAFVQTCLRAAGVDSGPQTMWVSNTIGYFRGQGRAFTEARHAQPGDLVAFEWGTTAGGYDHIGFVESVRPDGLVTIEGNIGNRVQRLFRSWTSGMAEFARPAYTEPAPIPPSVTPPAAISFVFRIGSTGDYVRKIQQIVGVSQDGVYGSQTANAVRIWQSKLGISADGVWGPGTQAATDRLFEFLGSLSNAPQMDAGLAAFLNALADATKHIYKLGSRGDGVKILQTLLIKKGIPVGGNVDGVFGYGTNHAVVTFQSRNGLRPDGVVGPATWAALTR